MLPENELFPPLHRGGDMHANGDEGKIEVAGKPMIAVVWDEEHQIAMPQFDPQKVKTFEFALMMLEGARLVIEEQRRMAQMQKIQQAVADAQMAQKVLRGR
jgi:hypothetical protein